jgi:DNA repair protein RecN (Recombination protein N)
VDALEADPARLDAVEERLEQIRRALRKHGGSEEQALRRLQELEAEFLMVESLEETREAAAAALREARERLSRAAGDLRARRKRAAKAFLRPLTALLKDSRSRRRNLRLNSARSRAAWK